MPSLVLISIVAALGMIWLIIRRRRISALPPTLPGLPLLGNILQLPITHLKLDQWKDQLGPIYSVNIAGQILVVIANAKVASDVLDKMAGVTSGRPTWIMGSEMMTGGMLLTAIQPGDRWRRQRRAVHEVLNTRSLDAFHHLQEDESLRLAHGLLMGEKLDDLGLHTERAAASTTWRTLYGGPSLALTGDKNLHAIDTINAGTIKVIAPGGAMVDVFPVLRYLPKAIAPFKRYADKFFEDSNGFFVRIFEEAYQRKTVSGDSGALNISTSLHDKKDKLGMSQSESAWLAGMLFIAATETSSTTLQYFVQAMLLYPEVAAKAREELDRTVGSQDPPTLADRDKLPYIQCILKEVLRWRPPAALGLPHVATEDFVYQNYTVPKGTMIVSNLWSICHDPELYPDYAAFRPDRFLSPEHGGTAKGVEAGGRFDDIAFGFGRRICPGKDVAMNFLFIDIAVLLWAFEFHKAKDAEGKEVTPSDMEFIDTVATIHPKPFPFELVPRSEHVKAVLADYGKNMA